MRDRILHTCMRTCYILFKVIIHSFIHYSLFISSLSICKMLFVHVSKSGGLISLQVLTVLWCIHWWTQSVGSSPSTQFLGW